MSRRRAGEVSGGRVPQDAGGRDLGRRNAVVPGDLDGIRKGAFVTAMSSRHEKAVETGETDLRIMECVSIVTSTDAPPFPVRYRRWKNHPAKGVDFPDTSPFASCGATARLVVDAMAQVLPAEIDIVGGIDVGGLGFAGALAYRNAIGLLDIRKVGSIRVDVIRNIMDNYELGDGVAISKANPLAGRCVAIIDDCLMTGGTALAAVQLVRRLGARCSAALFVFELDGMGGRAALEREGVSVSVLKTLQQAESSEAA